MHFQDVNKEKEAQKIGFDSGLRKQTHNILETGNKILIDVSQEKIWWRTLSKIPATQSKFMYLVGL